MGDSHIANRGPVKSRELWLPCLRLTAANQVLLSLLKLRCWCHHLLHLQGFDSTLAPELSGVIIPAVSVHIFRDGFLTLIRLIQVTARRYV